MRQSRITTMIILILALSTSGVFALSPEENAQKYQLLTLLPPIIAIILAFITKNVVFSLFIGILSGTILVNLNDMGLIQATITGFLTIVSRVLDSIADKWNAGILLQCLAIGGLIALVSRMGGARAVADALSKRAKTQKSAQLITWVAGLFVFFDDYANSLIVGPIMRPVTDKLKISREKLAFIVDATAAPISGLALVSTWVGYEVGLIKDSYASIGVDANAYGVFLETIPFRFYNILILLFIVVSAITLREFGPMLTAQRRAHYTGVTESKDSNIKASSEDHMIQPKEGVTPNVWNAIIPVGTLIVTSLVGFYMNGYESIIASENVELIEAIKSSPLSFMAIRETFGASDASIVLFQSALISGVVAMLLGVSQKIFTLSEAVETWIEGMKGLVITGVILLLAWSLSGVIKELGTAKFLVSILSGNMPSFLLPSLIFILASIISFATGTSFGTMGILMPLAIPLASSMGVSQDFIVASAGAVLTGAIFGDHCSPISDTTILSSMATSCDHIEHTRTQLVYAVSVAIISVIFGYIPVGLGMNVYMVMPIAMAAIVGLLFVFGKRFDNASEIEIERLRTEFEKAA